MANPPITIGPFTNVPAPGSPIKSDWPQTISNFLWSRYPRGLMGFAYAPGGPTGVGAATVDVTGMSVAWTTVAARKYLVIAQFQVTKYNAGDAIVSLTDGANAVHTSVNTTHPGTGYASPVAWFMHTGDGAAATVKGRVSAGAGTLDIRGASVLAVVDVGTGTPIQ